MPATTVQAILAAAQAPARDRTADYSARLDAHLATLAESARLPFLRAQSETWIERYRVFCQQVDSGRVPLTADGPTAWDYQFTLCAIDVRIGRLTRQPEAVAS